MKWKKRALMIEIHFHLDGRAEYLSEGRDGVLMWITLQSHHGKIELGCCVYMSLNSSFQGHHKTLPNPWTHPPRQTSKRESERCEIEVIISTLCIE